ncbi:MAG: ABC-type transport auxiliary lipoprotein family protein, partial [Myxococcota bacterium]
MSRTLLLLLCCGCVNANPTLYLLPPVPAGVDGVRDVAVGILEVKLPDYARDVRLVEALGSGTLVHREEHRWADTPTRAIGKALAQALRAGGVSEVMEEPWPAGFSPNVRVTVEFDALYGRRGGEVLAQGHLLVQRDGEGSFRYEPFEIVESVDGDA